MADHLHHRALQAQARAVQVAVVAHQAEGDEDAQRHEAHVRDRRIGDQLLHVVLHQRHQAHVHHRDQRQHDDEHGPLVAGVRHDRQAEAQQAVTADLQRDRRQDHRARGRGLHVRIRQPGVHREHRDLYRERDQEGEEQPRLFLRGQRHRVQVGQLEAAALDVQVHQADQHQHRAQERVQEELQRRIDAARTAPDADDQEHRDQHRLEEHIEQHRVAGREDAVGQAFQDQERGHVLGHALVHRPPRAGQRQHRDQRVEQQQGDGDAIGAQVVVDVEARDPGVALDELQARIRIVETAQQPQAEDEGQHRHGEAQPAGRAGAGIAQREHQRATQDGQPDQNTKQGPVRHVVLSVEFFARTLRTGRRRVVTAKT